MARTPSAIYNSEQCVSRLRMEREKAEIKHHYPDTGGHPGLFHNWYVCSRDPEVSNTANALRKRFLERSRKVRAWFNREYYRAEHAKHIVRDEVGCYLWCDWCQCRTTTGAGRTGYR